MLETPLSAENVERLMQESHFQTATQSLSPLGKAFLREHLNVKTNIATIATFVEGLVTAAHSSKSTNPKTIADLEVVAAAVNSIQNQNNRSKLDLYLLTSHPNAGSALYNTYYKEESISILGLKCVDPLIDKAAKEVEAARKAGEASKKAVGNNAQGRGRGRGRGNDYSDRSGHNNYEPYYNSGFPQNNNRGHYHGYRGGRGGSHFGNFSGNYQSNPPNGYQGNGYQNQGQQNGQNAFQPKVLGWMPQQN